MTNKHLLTVQIPIDSASDDPEARVIATVIAMRIKKNLEMPKGAEPTFKLQRLNPGQPPTGLKLDIY